MPIRSRSRPQGSGTPLPFRPIADARQGYYTFSATVKDAAGNESAPVSRVALHDGTAPPAPGLFLVPAGDGYNSTVVLSEDLSIKSYSTAVVLPTLGNVQDPELVASVGTVDAYNAASLTTSKVVQGAVNLPYKALQVDAAAPVPIDDFKVYSTNQAGTSSSTSSTITVDISGIDPVEFRAGETERELTVVAPTDAIAKDKDDIKVTVTADMADNVASLDAPFSVVRLYATVSVGPTGNQVTQLRQVGIVPAAAATTKLTDDPGRDWIFETTLDADAFWAAVEDTVDEDAVVHRQYHCLRRGR